MVCFDDLLETLNTNDKVAKFYNSSFTLFENSVIIIRCFKKDKFKFCIVASFILVFCFKK